MGELKVGQTVYVKRERGELQETTITKVGRKYFYLEYPSGLKIDKETLKEVSYTGWPATVYLDREEYENKILKNQLAQRLYRYHNWDGLSIESLRKINDIIKEETKKDD